MRIGFLASLSLAVISVCCGETPSLRLDGGGSLSYAVQDGKTVFSIRSASTKATRVAVQRDASVAANSAPDSVKLIAEMPKSFLVVVDSYPSIPGSMSFCQAGEESFLRVLNVAAKRPAETYRTKVESCRSNVELASPGIQWSKDERTVTIHWLSAPGSLGKPQTLSLKIHGEGKTTETKTEQ